MKILSRAVLAAALLCSLSPAFGQSAPPPVPALPDTERRTSYTISGSTCSCAVNFALYGDSTDYQNWVEVFINGVPAPYNDGNVGWTITSPAGPLSTIPRPITDAVLTFNTTQTGTIQIVGARRPRRISQFTENRGVAARDLNQALTDIIAQNRETWDKTNDVSGRAVLARPGETLALLPVLASRQNLGACFDNSGNLTSCVSVPSGTFTAGTGILFTGSNPTTVSNNITAGSGITISGSNPLTIAITGTTVAKTANYTVAPSDCGGTIAASGGPWTLTLPSPSGFSNRCAIQACNTDANDGTHHAIRLSGWPAPSLIHLWMGQCQEVSIVNAAWSITKLPGRFRPTFVPTLYVDTGGSDLNDGLVSNSGANALRNPQQCWNIFKSEFDLSVTAAPAPPTCSPTAGQIFTGGINCTSMGTNSVYYLVGNGGTTTIRNTGGNVVVQESDFCGYIIFDGVNLDCTLAASHPCYGLYLHQQNGADLSTGGFTTGVQFTGANGTDFGVWCDSECKVNANSVAPKFSGTFASLIWIDLNSVFSINNGLIVDNSATVSGSAFQVTKGSQLTFNNLLTFGTSTSVGQLFYATNGSNILISGSFLIQGSMGGGGRQWSILNNALFCNASGTTVPGTAGINSLTGWANGIIAASTNGVCFN